MYQYSFFQVEEKPWEDIDEVWLLEYMQEHFPDLFFEIDNGKVKSKDGQSELSVNISILKNYERNWRKQNEKGFKQSTSFKERKINFPIVKAIAGKSAVTD